MNSTGVRWRRLLTAARSKFFLLAPLTLSHTTCCLIGGIDLQISEHQVRRGLARQGKFFSSRLAIAVVSHVAEGTICLG